MRLIGSIQRPSLRILCAYVLFSGAYIWVSDWLLLRWVHDPQILTSVQNYKGWAFVLFSAGLLYHLIHGEEKHRLEVEAVIRQERDFSAKILESLPGVFYCYEEEFRFKKWNKNLERFTGLSADEIATRNPLDFVVPQDRERLRQAIQQVFTEGWATLEVNVLSPERDAPPYFLTGLKTEIEGKPHLIGLGIDVTARKEAEESLRRSREQLRALAARLQSSREEERIRISREIHDELGQQLTGLKMDLQWIEGQLTKITDGKLRTAVEDKIVSASHAADATMATVQRIASELRPPMLDRLGLVSALRHEAQQFSSRSDIQLSLDVPEEAFPLDKEIATTVYRVFQEMLTNVARHAEATEIRVRLRHDENRLRLSVEDNGKGLTAEDASNPSSLGVLGMKERAAMVGGQLEIEGSPGRGARVQLEVPLPAAEKTGTATFTPPLVQS